MPKLDISGDAGPLLKELEKLRVAHAKLEQQMKDLGKTSEHSHKKAVDNTSSMDNSLVSMGSKLASIAAGWVSITAATRLAAEAFNEYQAERQKGQAETARLEDSRRNILQISTGDMSQMMGRVDDLSKKYGLDRAIVGNALFSARSEGWEGSLENVLRADPLISVGSQAKVAGQVRTAVSNKLSPDSVVAGAYGGSVKSRLDFDPFARELVTAAEGGAAFRSEEDLTGNVLPDLIGITSVMAGGTSEAGARVRDLWSKLGQDKRTRGGGGIAELEKLMAFSEKDRKKFLGRDMGKNFAYSYASTHLDEIKRQSEEAKANMANPLGPDSAIQQRLDEFHSIKVLADQKTAQRTAQGRLGSAEKMGSSIENRNTAFLDELSTMRNEGSLDAFQYFMLSKTMGFKSWTGQDIQAQMGKDGAYRDDPIMQKVMERIAVAMERPEQAGAKAGEQRNVHQESDGGH